MKMLKNNCLLEPLPEQTQTESGIHLPQGQVGDVKMYWKVLAISETADPKPDFAVGDTVITPLHFTHTTLEDGTGRKIVGIDQIIGKFAEEAPEPFVPEIVP